MEKINLNNITSDSTPEVTLSHALQDKKAPQTTESKTKSKLSKKFLISLVIILLLFFLFMASAVAAAYFYAKGFEPHIRSTVDSISGITVSFQEKNLIKVGEYSDTAKIKLEAIDGKYQKISFLKKAPLAGVYFNDVQHAINAARDGLEIVDDAVKAISPYSDLLGLEANSDQNALEANSIEDRIIFLVETLDKIAPKLEELSSKAEKARDEINQIDANRYPEEIAGKKIRSKIIDLQSTVSEFTALLTQARPMIKLLPALLGEDEQKLYMLLFQNDAELRPTGGFLTAYAYLQVHRGKIEPKGSFDIYDLDSRFRKIIPSPDPIKKYLKESNWNLRNMNINPDFKLSMDTFYQQYKNIPGVVDVDGIIAIDTTVPVSILEIIGPIGVGGWGNFSAQTDKRCDCPQVVYALEEIADRPVNRIVTGRKAVLGPLMHSMMANAFGSPKKLWPKLFNTALTGIKQKHIFFYFPDEKTQSLAQDFNAAGRIKTTENDYLMIVDTNFGGAKTDMFIDRSVEQNIETQSDGTLQKTVTVTYDNPHKGSNCNLEAGGLCLNGKYQDWIRVLAPKGSKLISVVGSEEDGASQDDDELGKTIFSGFFTMRPESSSKLVFTFTLPDSISKDSYKLEIQKQGGQKIVPHTIIFNGQEKKIDLNSDIEVAF